MGDDYGSSWIQIPRKKFRMPLFNMNEDPEYTCDYFTDASHMSTKCFPD
ncbi:MAG TPA: DUF1574 family protein [Leptospiraceae bacterium]|nr:DUF1574 family protein [Leptospiraceae bacterium]HMW08686.1 DUF1574 family protein [Leptospiraceae bacterium]HMY32357.1 DUF1574 family protein [Leptospiraceae bacterium]HMZ62441.1 DUF1574 family protein [Leptospiraceae bacterium]HNC00508.1 DUF1574 family protein [Leptospiraceae bacterium]